MSSILTLSDSTIINIDWEHNIVQYLSHYSTLQNRLNRSVMTLYLHVYDSTTDLSIYPLLTILTINCVDHSSRPVRRLPSSILHLTIVSTVLHPHELQFILPLNLITFNACNEQQLTEEHISILPSSITSLSGIVTCEFPPNITSVHITETHEIMKFHNTLQSLRIGEEVDTTYGDTLKLPSSLTSFRITKHTYWSLSDICIPSLTSLYFNEDISISFLCSHPNLTSLTARMILTTEETTKKDILWPKHLTYLQLECIPIHLLPDTLTSLILHTPPRRELNHLQDIPLLTFKSTSIMNKYVVVPSTLTSLSLLVSNDFYTTLRALTLVHLIKLHIITDTSYGEGTHFPSSSVPMLRKLTYYGHKKSISIDGSVIPRSVTNLKIAANTHFLTAYNADFSKSMLFNGDNLPPCLTILDADYVTGTISGNMFPQSLTKLTVWRTKLKVEELPKGLLYLFARLHLYINDILPLNLRSLDIKLFEDESVCICDTPTVIPQDLTECLGLSYATLPKKIRKRLTKTLEENNSVMDTDELRDIQDKDIN